MTKMLRNWRWVLPLGLLLLAGAPRAFAHAILIRSTPADGSVVHTRNVTLTLDYNSRIDGARSTLTLTGPAGRTRPIQRRPTAKRAELRAFAANLANGAYHVHWQVLASDGHITRGDISFTIQAR
jgi:hypothetical protein